MTQMPLRSYRGTLPALSHEQAELAERLSADVKYLSVTVGERNLQRVGSLKATVEYLADNLRRAGYVVSERNYSTDGQVVTNVEVTLPGTDRASGTVVVGAHYDSVAGTVGANDNATGVAGVLELARLLRGAIRGGRFALCYSSMKSRRIFKLKTWEAWFMLVSYGRNIFLLSQ